MKVYVDSNYEVYTEETINEAIIDRMERCNYDGLSRPYILGRHTSQFIG